MQGEARREQREPAEAGCRRLVKDRGGPEVGSRGSVRSRRWRVAGVIRAGHRFSGEKRWGGLLVTPVPDAGGEVSRPGERVNRKDEPSAAGLRVWKRDWWIVMGESLVSGQGPIGGD